ncbi:phage tail tape measure protein [Modicisalibacter sp. MOD 31.J]|uniref:phage tail tape measure protein n=1 Tax=Modicisalibacter sp. MOD 31.J TaxID=2831897 RepID=UPI001CCC67A1|nr:phage tail tape measure protein [Modicisalibacter sp. MOD 31.J]MBZ9576737.1 phage tail tape measure protein [Modicisalibacter sp. MOD 31.J]
MARDLKLEVMLRAIDQATRPMKAIQRSTDAASSALKEQRQKLKRLQAVQKDVSAFKKLKNQSNATGQALREQQERIKRLSRQMKDNQGDSAALAAERRKAIEQARKLSRRYDDERQTLQRLRSTLDQSGVDTRQLGQAQQHLSQQISEANREVDEQKRKLQQLAAQQRRAQQASQQFDRSMGRINAARGAGMTGLAAGGAALYAGSRLLAPGVEWFEQMSQVQALTRLGKNDARMDALRQQSRDLGSSTAFSATEVGQGQAFLAMAGFTPDAIHTAMEDMLNLALANDMDLGRTADISSNILSGFGLDPDQMGRVGDVLTATTTRANVDLEMLGESMKYVAPQAKAMGLSLEQAAAMAGLLGNVGIQGSQAGTTLRAMMTRLAAPTGKAAGALETLGINAQDADGNLRDVPRILADVARATENMGNADRAGYLKAIFGEEPGAGMAELIDQQGAAGVERFVGILENAAGESSRVAKTMADNIGGDLKGLKSAWEEVGISITDTNEGPLRELIQNVTAITRAVGNWIKENPELAGGIAKAAAGLAILVAVGGAFTIMMASILGPIVTVRYGLALLSIQTGGTGGKLLKLAKGAIPAIGKALLWLGRTFALVGRMFLLNPIGLAITAIAGAAYLIYRNWDDISQFFRDRWADVKAAFDDGAGAVIRLLLNWNPIGLIYRAAIAGLEKLGVDVPDRLGTLGDAILAAWDVIKNGAMQFWEGFTSLPGKAIDAIRDMVAAWDLMGQLKAKWDEAIAYLKELPGSMWQAGKDVASGVGKGIKDGAGAAVDAAGEMADNVGGWFKDKLGIRSPSRVFAEYGRHTVDGLTLGLQDRQREPLRAVDGLARNLKRAGAGMALGTAALPAMAIQPPTLPDLPALEIRRPSLPTLPDLRIQRPDVADLAIDRRPPLQSSGGNTVNITIGDINVQPAPGMDERALARYVAAEVQRALDDAARDRGVRRRSAFNDID